MTWGSLLWAPITLMALGNKEFLMNITSHNIVVYWSVLMIFLSGLQVPWRQGQYFLYTLLFSSQHTITLMVCVQSLCHVWLFLQPHGLKPARLLCSWDFPGKNTGPGCHFPLQGIFPTQGLNPCPSHWEADSLPLCHLGLLGLQILLNNGQTCTDSDYKLSFAWCT